MICILFSPNICTSQNRGSDWVGFANIYLFIRFYLFIFRERGKEGERNGEKHQCVVASHTSSTGDLACNPGMCPDWGLNQQPFTSQSGAQSTEPHQPGLRLMVLTLSEICYFSFGKQFSANSFDSCELSG